MARWLTVTGSGPDGESSPASGHPLSYGRPRLPDPAAGHATAVLDNGTHLCGDVGPPAVCLMGITGGPTRLRSVPWIAATRSPACLSSGSSPPGAAASAPAWRSRCYPGPPSAGPSPLTRLRSATEPMKRGAGCSWRWPRRPPEKASPKSRPGCRSEAVPAQARLAATQPRT